MSVIHYQKKEDMKFETAGNGILRAEMLPGTAVRCRMRAPSGSPIVYEIRGASVAIRRKDAEKITVRPEAPWD